LSTEPLQPSTKKTFKREVAILLFIFLAYVVETKDVEIVEALVWPTFTFAALAYGMDWFGKSGSNSPLGGMWGESSQSPNRRGSERSSEYSSGEREYPDDR